MALYVSTVMLDGEAVVLDAAGRSHFGALQQALGGRGGKRGATEAVFMAFDMLYLDGHDLTGVELLSRRHLLEGLALSRNGALRLSEEVEGDGDALLQAACEHGLEGIIAKHRDRPYRSGRTGDWVKIKCVASAAFIIVGYEPSSVALAGIGSLLLAARQGHDFVYVGSVLKKSPISYGGRRKDVDTWRLWPPTSQALDLRAGIMSLRKSPPRLLRR